MKERQKVGILFRHSENWIGGTYYILNLIHAINLLDESEKPSVYLLSDTEKEFVMVRSETAYPYLVPVRMDVFRSGGIFSFLKKKRTRDTIGLLDLVFPFPFKPDGALQAVKRKVYWIGDFQEKYLPAFFSEKALQNREAINREIAGSGAEVVFSSMNAWTDFDRFYPHNKCRKYLLQFAVTHPDISDTDPLAVMEKYKVSRPYFISPNQFWAHKNHHLIIDAVYKLVSNGSDITLLFTGKEFDYRYPDYTETLKKKVKDLKLEKHIRFLGFIDRKEQLVLMKHARAVVQASLFEGWSTVVEDAKCLNVPLILSDLPVHREQDPANVVWFDKTSVDSLAARLAQPPLPMVQHDYTENRLRYAQQYKTILNATAG